MTRLNWKKVGTENAIRSGGTRCVVDETEYRKADAAARWLERNDRPKAGKRHRSKPSKPKQQVTTL